MSDTVGTDAAPEVEHTLAPTRPAAASRHARRPKAQRKVTRYTLDLESEMHLFLRLYSIQNGVEASRVCRTLLYLLEADESLQQRVYDELFAEDED